MLMHALDVLETLEEHPDGLAAREIISLTGCSLSSVYRILRTLGKYSYVASVADGRYVVVPHLIGFRPRVRTAIE